MMFDPPRPPVVYALGDVQSEQPTPWVRHAVDLRPLNVRSGVWAQAMCPARPRVWVHAVAGEPVEFPGNFGFVPGVTCPDCMSIVERHRPVSPDEEHRPPFTWRRGWLRDLRGEGER